MKVMFCHDGPMYVDDTNQYYAGVISDEIIDNYQKYLKISQFTIVSRVRNVNNKKAASLSALKSNIVTVREISDLTSITNIISKTNQTKKYIEEEVKKHDLIIIRLPGIAGIYALKYANKYKKKYVTEIVGCAYDALKNHSFKGRLIAPVIHFLNKQAIKSSKNNIYVTDKYLQKQYPSNGKSIGCSDVIIPDNSQKVLNQRVKKIMSKSHLPLVLGSLGNLSMKYKGYDDVIKVLSQINKNQVKLILKIKGPGNREWLDQVIMKNHAQDFVIVEEPTKSHDEVFDWLNNLDIYIQPSKTEGLPRALIEAMCCACPCIGRAVGGITELINEEMLFKNNKELFSILNNIDVAVLEKHANMNFKKSKEYNADAIKKKKQQFYREIGVLDEKK